MHFNNFFVVKIKLVICGTADKFTALSLDFRTIVLAEELKTPWFYANECLSLFLC